MAKILWADDEIDLLKPHLMFLKTKGYDVVTATNGHDAVDLYAEEAADIDVVFLDESMPGLTGLEVLPRIKERNPAVPVVLITKNEAEHVMEEAIGSQISDYLIKPVHPNQILLTLKKLMDNKRLVSEKTAMSYQQEFRQIFMQITGGLDHIEWVDAYRKIINWELKVDANEATGVTDILAQQKQQANTEFSKFVLKNYYDWVDKSKEVGPVMSHSMMRKHIFPHVGKGVPTIVVLLDNLRYDQWKTIEPYINEQFKTEQEGYFFSILPTATQYSRNAIFAGMMPAEIEQNFPDKWKNDADEGGKNLFEDFFLEKQLDRVFRKGIKWDYVKVTNVNHGKELTDNILNCLNNDLTVIVYNFIDMLSHARTEMEVLKELAGDERAYRSLTRSWFLHSPLWTALRRLEGRDVQLFVTTDHGTIRVQTPSKVVGDRETTTNLRYKVGRNLQYEARDVLAVKDPKQYGLPRPNISSTFIFAKEDHYFLYPNNYNHFNNYYRNTFQHGGISLEEMICPVIRLRSKT
ncbi:MAG TPA: bifunctional response regulator/alkaline phosphatase family protein [Saprospiraceae bacterium]|nr:bifunctional response regulator/alkaline phosphatase family protein [Saprospiraceae bacterium]HND87197.1 bifunctional response regulator/alkaline phosphatase family protein [Saprospiraceae bacterium]HNG88884.1 bifunctional response regulator/alkaline phosphatase family protein [Saprospiraceae bacterium]